MGPDIILMIVFSRSGTTFARQKLPQEECAGVGAAAGDDEVGGEDTDAAVDTRVMTRIRASNSAKTSACKDARKSRQTSAAIPTSSRELRECWGMGLLT